MGREWNFPTSDVGAACKKVDSFCTTERSAEPIGGAGSGSCLSRATTLPTEMNLLIAIEDTRRPGGNELRAGRETTMQKRFWIRSGAIFAATALGLGACESAGGDPADSTGGSDASGGIASTGGSKPSGGSKSTGGRSTGGADMGGGGAGASDPGGATGEGGDASGGAATGGAPACDVASLVPVPHGTCADLPPVSDNSAAPNFKIWSEEFGSCEPIPVASTCEGNAFGTGISPGLKWSGAPAQTKSFALVFKDISILSDEDPLTTKFGEHWVMWDIPSETTELPAALSGGHLSPDVVGARQWGGRNEYRFFPPCPNPFPANDARFACSLTEDSYAFVLYALDVPAIPEGELPDIVPQLDADGEPVLDMDGNPTKIANWVVAMDEFLMASGHVLASAEYRGTSDAWSTSFAPPGATKYPCTATTTTNCFPAP